MVEVEGVVEGVVGVEKKGKEAEKKKGEEAEKKKGEVEVKGVKRPPRAQRFWEGEGDERGNGSEGELREGKGEGKRKVAAPRRGKSNLRSAEPKEKGSC